MDGAGKTTLAKKITQFFEEKGFKFEFIHGHGYSVSQDSFGLDEKRVKSLKYLFKLLIPFALADNLFTFYFKYKPILKKKNLVCDRYFYDKIARMMYYGICSELLARICLRLLPKPDYIFFLDINPEQAYFRKGEYSEKEYNSFRNIYRFIADYLKAPVIDTSLSIDTCCREIFANSGLGKE